MTLRGNYRVAKIHVGTISTGIIRSIFHSHDSTRLLIIILQVREKCKHQKCETREQVLCDIGELHTPVIFKRRKQLWKNIFDAKGRIRGVHSSRSLLTSHRSGGEVMEGFFFMEKNVQRYCICSFSETKHRQHATCPPGQPATICLQDETGTLPRYKMQLGVSTAAEEELLPYSKGGVFGRGG